MGSVNKWIGIGNLGADPELKYTTSNKAVCSLSLACNETWKDKDGQKQEKVEWVRVNVWGNQAEACAKYLAKGKQVYVEGRLQTRSYDDKDGIKRYVTEVVSEKVVFLGSAGGDGEARGGQSSGAARRGWGDGGGVGQSQQQGFGGQSPDPADDDIPF